MKWTKKFLRNSWGQAGVDNYGRYWVSNNGYRIAESLNKDGFLAYDNRGDEPEFLSKHPTLEEAQQACLEHLAALPW